jgi:ribulose 1,5-bisphosphate synthetase/thiazole synthase
MPLHLGQQHESIHTVGETRHFAGTHRLDLDSADDFDVIVIGSGMGGMTTAAALSRMGRKVLLLEQAQTIGGLLGCGPPLLWYIRSRPECRPHIELA